MTEWKKVNGTQKERPAEVDRHSSPTTVYLRRNIEQVTAVQEEAGETITEWQYEERQMSQEEYANMLLMQLVTEDLEAMLIDTALNAEYTACLMETSMM